MWLLSHLLPRIYCITRKPTFQNNSLRSFWKFIVENSGIDEAILDSVLLTIGAVSLKRQSHSRQATILSPAASEASTQVWFWICDERDLRFCRVGWNKLMQGWKRTWKTVARRPEQAQSSQNLWTVWPSVGWTPEGRQLSWHECSERTSCLRDPEEGLETEQACRVPSSLEPGQLFWYLRELTTCQVESFQNTGATLSCIYQNTQRAKTASPKLIQETS